MSLKTKKRFKNIGKVVAGVLFAAILFTNIKVALMDETEILSGDISLLGVELTLFEATYACVVVGDATCIDYGCFSWGDPGCAIYLNSMGWYTYCYYWHIYE